MNLDNFDWGWMEGSSESSVYHKNQIIEEIFNQKAYERFFEVEEGDIVFDFGSSVGTFTHSILNKNPKQVYCIEPSHQEIETLTKNVKDGPVTIINKGIGDSEGYFELNLFGVEDGMKMAQTTTFDNIREEFNITKIDFIKTDCEGGEYSVFNNKNIFWIKENVRKIVGEWHLSSEEEKQKFRIFRDTYLRLFPNIEVFSVDGVDIKWDLWNEHFINYYEQIIVYIDNRN
jgi:FkbM family methyltransferase